MKRITSLNDLLMEELIDLFNAENQWLEFLPKMIEASESFSLKFALEDHQKVTKTHVDRLKVIFSDAGDNPPKQMCRIMNGFINEWEGIVISMDKGQERDAALIRVAQRMELYEIDGYRTAREHAVELGHTKMLELLSENLNEERAMNFQLNELAQGIINIQAINPSSSRFNE